MHTVGDFVRIVVAVAVGCGFYDTIMLTVTKLRYRAYTKAVTEQAAALNARMEQLQAEARAKKA